MTFNNWLNLVLIIHPLMNFQASKLYLSGSVKLSPKYYIIAFLILYLIKPHLNSRNLLTTEFSYLELTGLLEILYKFQIGSKHCCYLAEL